MTRATPQASQAGDLRIRVISLAREPGAGDWACLDVAETERAHRFVFEPDRRRYVMAHAALRRALGAELGLPPSAVRWDLGPQGKPQLAPEASCHFNLSHSQDVAVIALSRQRELGVDIEVLRPMPDALDVARTVFTPAEQEELAQSADPNLAFLQGWTRKEACIKAVGSGLSLAPATFQAGLVADERGVAMTWQGRTEQVWVSSLSLAGELVGAVAFREHRTSEGERHA